MLSADLVTLALCLEECMAGRINVTPEGQEEFLNRLKKAAEDAAAMEFVIAPVIKRTTQKAFTVINGGRE